MLTDLAFSITSKYLFGKFTKRIRLKNLPTFFGVTKVVLREILLLWKKMYFNFSVTVDIGYNEFTGITNKMFRVYWFSESRFK